MKKVRVPLENHSYDILIGQDLILNFPDYLEGVLSRKFIAIITDKNVENLHLSRLVTALSEARIETKTLSIDPGEGSKSWKTLQATVEWMLANKIERNDMVVALGGGVVGDLVGFAAAILRRGIRFIQCPTSLLAQVDSSVGGKTGINSPHGKNLIGAFHQPLTVLADLDCLDSLPRRQLLAGYAEITKYGLINDPDFFHWLEQNGSSLIDGNKELQAQAILRSCAAKAKIVAQDEYESGIRALLNLGHTFAHALEAEVGYGETLLHGEAVSIGMITSL